MEEKEEKNEGGGELADMYWLRQWQIFNGQPRV